MRWIRCRRLLTASPLIGLAIAAGAAVPVPTGPREPADRAAAVDSPAQTEARLLEEIKYLASDELEGRGIGTAGLNKAADFMRREFQGAGLDVTRVRGGAFQTFSMPTKAKLGAPNTLRLLGF